MCGFAALVRVDGNDIPEAVLREMSARLGHRGPDDHGVLHETWVGLAFRRLSILDLSPAGHQPMSSDDGALTIVFNGEIFNYVELRTELQAKGHRFRSTGDTEVLLAAYREWGTECLHRLNGMFALIIYDRAAARIFGARDRFGVKPLYRMEHHGMVAFASEIKALSAVCAIEVDRTRLLELAAAGRADLLDEPDRTFFSGVRSVPAGGAFTVGRNQAYREYRWWSLSDQVKRAPAPTDPVANYAELFDDAVRLRMRSDVPIGVMLSGGLDSTAIACAMRRSLGPQSSQAPLHAFMYQDPAFDERQYVTDTMRQVSPDAHVVDAAQRDIVTDLQRLLWAHDEPVHSSTALVGYWLYDLAAKAGVRVVLGGQGADEVLAGYLSYFAPFWRELLLHGEWGRLSAERRAMRAIGAPATVPTLPQMGRQVVGNLLRQSSWYRERITHGRDGQVAAWAMPTAAAQHAAAGRAATPEPWSLEGALEQSVTIAPLPLYLRIEDRNSMAHSVEARVPFLDWRLVVAAAVLPSAYKLRNARTKVILRDAMAGRIPDSVRLRTDKMGFPVDTRTMFHGRLLQCTHDLLHTDAARERDLYDLPRLQALAARPDALSGSEADALFQFVQLELWMTSWAEWRPAA